MKGRKVFTILNFISNLKSDVKTLALYMLWFTCNESEWFCKLCWYNIYFNLTQRYFFKEQFKRIIKMTHYRVHINAIIVFHILLIMKRILHLKLNSITVIGYSNHLYVLKIKFWKRGNISVLCHVDMNGFFYIEQVFKIWLAL